MENPTHHVQAKVAGASAIVNGGSAVDAGKAARTAATKAGADAQSEPSSPASRGGRGRGWQRERR